MRLMRRVLLGIVTSLALVPGYSLAQDAPTRACDLAAASPLDQTRPAGVAGVDYESINPRSAMEPCRAALARDPNNPRLLFQMGRIFSSLKDETNARPFYERAAAQGHALAQSNLGLIYEEGRGGVPKNEREAARLFALAAAQGVALAQEGLARLCKLLTDRGDERAGNGDYDTAIGICNEAIRINPSGSVAYEMRGAAYQAKGNLELAIADYNKAIELNSQDADTFNRRGTAYYAKGDLDLAVANYSEAIRLKKKELFGYVFGESATVYSNRGIALRAQGDLRFAIMDFDKAIQLDPQHLIAYTEQGLAYEAQGDHTNAKADFIRALVLPETNETGKWAHDTARERLASLKAADEAQKAADAVRPTGSVHPGAATDSASWSFVAGDWATFGVVGLIGLPVLIAVFVVIFGDFSNKKTLQNTYAHGGARPSVTEDEALTGARGEGGRSGIHNQKFPT
jgi:tetratricopeptide (TPR) repeat protein